MSDDKLPPEFRGESHQDYARRITGAVLTGARETESGLQPLSNRAARKRDHYIAAAKLVAKIIGVLAPTVIGAVTAYRSAASEGEQRSQVVKNKSEAGYQVTRQALEALEHRVLVLEEAAHRAELAAAAQKALAAGQKAGVHRRLLPPPPPPPIRVSVTAHPTALPGNLDQAERQVYKGMPAAARSPPDAQSDRAQGP